MFNEVDANVLVVAKLVAPAQSIASWPVCLPSRGVIVYVCMSLVLLSGHLTVKVIIVFLRDSDRLMTEREL